MSELYLDHVLIAVHDLGQASRTYSEGLGFTLTPEGVHPGRGTHNRLVVFGPGYLELIAVRDASEGVFRPTMSRFLESREGLYMFAVGSRDVDATVAGVRERGLSIQDPDSGARQGDGGDPGYTWRFAAVPADATPGSETFIIQHDNTIVQRYPQPPNATRHDNGVSGIHHLSIAVLDAEESASRWENAFGFESGPLEDMPDRGMGRVRLRPANCYLDFVSPLRSGAMSRFLERNGEAPYLLALSVRNLSETLATLRERGVATPAPTSDPDGTSVTIDARYTHGVTLQLIQPAT